MNSYEQACALYDSIKALMDKPALRELTSTELKQQADRRRQYATGIKLNGGDVTPEYTNGSK